MIKYMESKIVCNKNCWKNFGVWSEEMKNNFKVGNYFQRIDFYGVQFFMCEEK